MYEGGGVGRLSERVNFIFMVVSKPGTIEGDYVGIL